MCEISAHRNDGAENFVVVLLDTSALYMSIQVFGPFSLMFGRSSNS